eukprot:Rhum_TRINITY_DN11216_c0_g1::Rhum_TRINITY_DN11216_c0_g1_i1::g.43392::m.43392
MTAALVFFLNIVFGKVKGSFFCSNWKKKREKKSNERWNGMGRGERELQDKVGTRLNLRGDNGVRRVECQHEQHPALPHTQPVVPRHVPLLQQLAQDELPGLGHPRVHHHVVEVPLGVRTVVVVNRLEQTAPDLARRPEHLHRVRRLQQRQPLLHQAASAELRAVARLHHGHGRLRCLAAHDDHTRRQDALRRHPHDRLTLPPLRVLRRHVAAHEAGRARDARRVRAVRQRPQRLPARAVLVADDGHLASLLRVPPQEVAADCVAHRRGEHGQQPHVADAGHHGDVDDEGGRGGVRGRGRGCDGVRGDRGRVRRQRHL